MPTTAVSPTPDHPTVDYPALLEQMLSAIASYLPGFSDLDRERVTRAFWYGESAHHDQRRRSGEPYFTHPVAATMILLEIRPDIDSIIACLLHDVIEDTPITAAQVEAEFGPTVRFLCEGVEKVSRVNLRNDQRGKKLETIKKLFIAVAKDIRVIFVKLADRIHNLSTLESVPAAKRQRIARESMEIYAPVALRFGLNNYKNRITDLSFQFLYPEAYTDLTQQLADTAAQREKFIEISQQQLETTLRDHRVRYREIKGRQKSLFSIYEKMKRKNLMSVSQVFDLIGFRVIIPDQANCYRALGAIHSQWTPMPGRFKDYISGTKPNGYKSLHTTVLGLGKSAIPTEIQIRTPKMDMDAEYGPAAHWAYKETKSSNFDQEYVTRMAWVPAAIDSAEQSTEAFYKKLSESILADRIYVYTPKGDVISLPADSTPIDFAYHIHSDVGHGCVGAKVNGAIKPLFYKLKNGEIVEIQTKTGRTPNPQWLKFIKSGTARSHIQNYLNKSTTSLEEPPETSPPTPSPTPSKTQTSTPLPRTVPQLHIPQGTDIIIGGQSDMPYHLASCCTPRLGHSIVAYKSRGLDFSIHSADCSTLRSFPPERVIDAYIWQPYTVTTLWTDRIGLLHDISHVLVDLAINLTDIIAKPMKQNQQMMYKITMGVQVTSQAELQTMQRRFSKIANFVEVISVESRG